MTRKSVYKVVFTNDGRVYEIYARAVGQASVIGFVEVEGLLFGEKAGVLVDPVEEKLRSEFAGVERTLIPIHAIVRIDQVEKRGAAKITPVQSTDKVRPLPTPLVLPGKKDK
jgi:hypothetical protein